MVAEADDGAELASSLNYFYLRRIADQDAGRAVARLSNRDVDTTAIRKLVDEGVDLKHVDRLLANRYSGWSKQGTGLNGHYQKHVVDNNEFGGPGSITPQQYHQKARTLLNDRNGEVYYQTDRDNLAVYDPADNAYAVGNANGRLQTLLEPDDGVGYVNRRIQNGLNIRLK